MQLDDKQRRMLLIQAARCWRIAESLMVKFDDSVRHVHEVLQEKIRRGERAGTIPYGFVPDSADPTGKKLAPHPGEQEIIGVHTDIRRSIRHKLIAVYSIAM